MPGGWGFALILLAAFVLTGVTSVWQMRRYTGEVNRLAAEFRGADRRLVSGRHKGWIRGAIVVLVVDLAAGEVLAAETLTGVSALARLRPAPALLGPLDTLLDRAPDKAIRKAVTDALTRLPGAAPATQPTPSSATNRAASQKVRISRRRPSARTADVPSG